MYNIPADTRKLPENAGEKGSSFGAQIVNDFFIGPEYDGPCPPANFHRTCIDTCSRFMRCISMS
jgi:phosphatidylethanolamine-binding protein (PEBP) family uncharacterized protein